MTSIPEHFKGKNIFITGGSGFVGKALIEKLLRSCPEIGNIFILLRFKKNTSLLERVRQITDNQLFDILKEKQPSAIDKIVPIAGDVTQLELGISETDKELLISKVNIIFHGAASVRFNDSLHKAIIVNVRGTRELISLALKCKNLEVFMHISTSYSNTDKSVIEEKYYPGFVPWTDAIHLAEQNNPNLNALTLKYIDPMPNTYTFTKRIAENVVVDMCEGNIPFVIMRPSIVIGSFVDPVSGWVDNLNGPHGLCMAPLKGLINVVLGKSDSVLNGVYVDNSVKAMITAVWQKGSNPESSQISIYNLTSDLMWKLESFSVGLKYIPWTIPLTGMISYNDHLLFTDNIYYYHFDLFIRHLVPAIFLDTILKLTGRKPRLMKLLRRIYTTNLALQYFMNNQFTFINDNYLNLEHTLLDSDLAEFRYQMPSKYLSTRKMLELGEVVIIGVKKYIFQEPLPVRKETFAHVKRLYYFSKAMKLLFVGLLLYWLIWKMDIVAVVCRATYNYFDKLDVS